MRLIHITRTVLAGAAIPLLLQACGGGGGSTVSSTPYSPGDLPAVCVPGSDVVGAWKTLSNNNTLIPDSANVAFFSYNQPSVNTKGMVVFRGRARGATGESGGSNGQGVTRGVFAIDACLHSMTLYTVADGNTVVPDPNSTGATFTEFPSIPRIDMNSGVLATRGESKPVWTLADGTQQGNAGIYATLPAGLVTGVGQLGSISEFSYMQVPGASTSGVRFDQFPGSPTLDGSTLLFKGNFTDGTIARTGIYFRDLSVGGSAVQRIADSSMMIPGTATPFGSTAPPSAAAGKVVFTGLDNETTPAAGGLFLAPIASTPTLNGLVQIGQTVVVDSSGFPLTGSPTFSQIGEGLAFDGRDVAFWGAWNSGTTRQVRMNCPTDGDAALINACLGQYPAGYAMLQDPVDQGIFVYDTVTGRLRMVAQAGSTAQFQDFLFWTFSGAPPSVGGDSTDAEPPRWRASSFAAVDSGRGVLFKGSLNATGGGPTPASGIYGASVSSGGAVGSVFKVVEVGDSMAPIDSAAPAGSTVSALGIEREALRSGWLTLTVSSLDAAGEGWAGVYASYFPSAFHVLAPVAPATMGTLALGS